MRLWRIIRRLKPSQLWQLSMLSMANLTKVWPTWKATKKSVAYASEFYGKSHHKNTPANAFRHALWSYLIALYSMKKKEQKDEVIQWAIKITDLHEDLFPNKPMARAMDLHNNHLGVHYFKNQGWTDEEEIVEKFKDLTGGSVLINELEELKLVPGDKMVHLVNTEAI